MALNAGKNSYQGIIDWINSTAVNGNAGVSRYADAATSATKAAQLTTGRKLRIQDTASSPHSGAKIEFNGTADIDIPLPTTIAATTFIGNLTGNVTGNLTGTADTAVKLSSSAGAGDKPIYFSSGKPVACGSSLAVNITGNCGGSSATCTGNSGSATKLNITGLVGESYKPVYFSNGSPVACSQLGNGSSNFPVYIPTSAPSNPQNGMIWIES
ncbi:MAG: hypothetical protein J6Y02_18130 [Pseudobutyrivibrio sp.]|nr:hypothetical protein [Pseudobutyrivibrio sp.]